MTDPNNAAQAAEHVETLQRMRADYNPSDGPMSALKAAALDAALSKLRAEGVQAGEPVANERVTLALAELRPPGIGRNEQYRAGWSQGVSDATRAVTDALASAPASKPKRAPLDDWRVQAIAECLETEWDDMTPASAEADARLIVGYLIAYEKESDEIEARYAAEPVAPVVQAVRSLRASAPVAGEAQVRKQRVLTDDERAAVEFYSLNPSAAVRDLDKRLAGHAAPQASEAQCSCPSGDGSLRWPCAVHTDCAKDAGDEQSIELASLRDMLEEARAEIELVREALGVPYEPHQTLFDRILDACDVLKTVEAYRRIDNARSILEWLNEDGRVAGSTLHADRPGHWLRSCQDGTVKSGELVQHLLEIMNEEASTRAALSAQPGAQNDAN